MNRTSLAAVVASLMALGGSAAGGTAALHAETRTAPPTTASGLIAYSLWVPGKGDEVVVRAADGSSPAVDVTGALSGGGFGPSWAPDGRRLAYVREDGIWVVNADGSGRRRVTSSPSGWDGLPVWSPDGRRIAFIAGWSDHKSLVQVVAADGSDLHTVARIDPGRQDAEYRPSWSPDGRRLVVWSNCAPIRIVRVSDGEQRAVTRKPGCSWGDFGPSWSPTGNTISFVHNNWGRSTLWTVRSNGSGLQQLTGVGHRVGDPAWSPDGKRIAYTSGSSLAVANADGSGAHTLLRNFIGRYTWSPDGKSLAIVRFIRGCGPSPRCVVDLDTITADGRSRHHVATGPIDYTDTPGWTR